MITIVLSFRYIDNIFLQIVINIIIVVVSLLSMFSINKRYNTMNEAFAEILCLALFSDIILYINLFKIMIKTIYNSIAK